MTIKDQLLADMKEAMKNKDTVKKDTIQMIRASILQIEKDKQITLDDEGVIDTISKELKKRKDVLPDYEKSGRTDLLDVINREIEILLCYLPSQLSEEELDTIVKDTISETGATSMKDMGKLMPAIMEKVKGRGDGRTVNGLVRKYLA